MLYIGTSQANNYDCSVFGRKMVLYKKAEGPCNVTYVTSSIDSFAFGV